MGFTSRRVSFVEDYQNSKSINDKVDKFYDEIWLPNHSFTEEEKMFYHFTNIDGLEGIIENREIWFSHINCLNDPKEIDYGRDLVREILDQRLKEEEDPAKRTLLNSIYIFIGSLGSVIHQPFIFCFCESFDVLSQWRSYGDKGKGYCLGFNISEKTKLITDKNKIEDKTDIYLRKVIYERKEQDLLVNKLIDLSIKGLEESIKELQLSIKDADIFAASCSGIFSSLLIDLVLSFKSEVFSEEKEWRLLRVMLKNDEPNSLKFRKVAGEIIPYRSSSLINVDQEEMFFSLASIHFGPSMDSKRTKTAIEHYLINQSAKENNIPLYDYYKIPVNNVGYKLR